MLSTKPPPPWLEDALRPRDDDFSDVENCLIPELLELIQNPENYEKLHRVSNLNKVICDKLVLEENNEDCRTRSSSNSSIEYHPSNEASSGNSSTPVGLPKNSEEECIEIELELPESQLRKILFNAEGDYSFDFLKLAYESGWLNKSAFAKKLFTSEFSSKVLKDNEQITVKKVIDRKGPIMMWKNKAHLYKTQYIKQFDRNLRFSRAFDFMMSCLRKRSPK